MPQEIATFHQTAALANPEELDKALEQSRAVRPQASTGQTYLRMNREGNWVFGGDNIEVEDGALWAINTYSMSHGWVAWIDGQKEGEVMVPFNEPLPEIEGEGWDAQVGFQLACISGEDEGTQVTFFSSSNGGKKAYSAIYDAIADRPEQEYEFPVIELSQSSWQSKKYGKIYEPVFLAKDWANKETELLGGNGAAKPKAVSRGGRKATTKPAVKKPTAKTEEKADTSAPPRRRRRATGS